MGRLPAPNHTQVPNALFALLPYMSEAEIRVSLLIARETFGWHRESKELSLSTLMSLTGLSRQGVINGIEAGMKRGIIERTEKGQSFCYRLLVNEVDQSEGEVVNEVDRSGQRSRPEVVNEVDRQLVNEVDTPKEIEEKKIKETRKETQRGAQGRACEYVYCGKCNGKIRVTFDSNRGSPVAPCMRCNVEVLSAQAIAMDDTNLKAEAGKCKSYYEHSFSERFGGKPHVTKGKDFSILVELVGQYGKKTVQGFIDKFLALTDEKLVDAGYPIAWLPNRINSLIVNGNGSTKLPPKAQKTQANLQSFRSRRTGQ